MNGGPKIIPEQSPPSLYSQFADTQVTVFGMSGTIKDLEGLCPVPPEQRTPEAMERFTAKVLTQAGVKIPEEFSHLVEVEATENQVNQAAQAETSVRLEPKEVSLSEPKPDPIPLAVRLEAPEPVIETVMPAKTVEKIEVAETSVELPQPPSQQELAAVVQEHNERLHKVPDIEQEQPKIIVTEVVEPIVVAEKSKLSDPPVPEVVVAQPDSSFAEVQPAPEHQQIKEPETSPMDVDAIDPYKAPVEREFVQPVEASVSLEPEAQQLAEELGLPTPIEAAETEDDSWIDNIILAHQIEANEAHAEFVLLPKPQELIVEKISETIELGSIQEEQAEALIQVLPPAIQESLVDYVEQVKNPEIVEKLAVEIAPLADRLNSLVLDGQANSPEAIEAKQALIEWYEELTDQFEINEDKSAVNNFIAAICSSDYKTAKITAATEEPIDNSLHERKYVHKPFDIKFATKLTQVLQTIELEVAKLMIQKSLAA